MRSYEKPILITLLVTFIASLIVQQPTVEALWFFQDPTNQTLGIDKSTLVQIQSDLPQQQEQEAQDAIAAQTAQQSGSGNLGAYGSSLLSIAGIQPSSIASLLNTVGDTGFKYFNIQDQCRNRAACDLGHMLYRKLSFVHNWLIRTSVRTLTDMNNVYTQSWMEGMLGRNCTAVYASCHQSPLEGLMNLALLQHLAT